MYRTDVIQPASNQWEDQDERSIERAYSSVLSHVPGGIVADIFFHNIYGLNHEEVHPYC